MPLNHFTPMQFVALAAHIAGELGWQLSGFSENSFSAQTNNPRYAHNATIRFEIEDGTVYLQSQSLGNEMFDRGQNAKNLDAFTNHYYILYNQYSPEQLDAAFLELKVLSRNAETHSDAADSNWTQGFKWRRPGVSFFITPTLVAVNLIVYIAMVATGADALNPALETLISWGGNSRSLTLNGEPWRLLSCMFVHIGLVHLIFNMSALFYVGALLEPKLKSGRFLLAYVLTGICASLVSVWMSAYTISAGASGAIFGMYGVCLALLTTNFIDKSERKVILPSIALFVIYNLVAGLDGKIDAGAHLGGLLSGLLLGYLLLPALSEARGFRSRFAGSLIMVSLMLGFGFLLFRYLPAQGEDLAVYQQKMTDFVEQESLALEVHGHYGADYYYGDASALINEIRQRSDYYWKENLAITHEVDALELPQPLYRMNTMLREYCELNLSMNNLICKQLSQHTTQYQSQVDAYKIKIQKLADKITQFNQEALPQR